MSVGFEVKFELMCLISMALVVFVLNRTMKRFLKVIVEWILGKLARIMAIYLIGAGICN